MSTSSLVSTQWLADHLDDHDLVILDGSFKLPGVTPLASEDFALRHIPGAQFFDIDAIADHETSLPHMLPSPAEFARAVEAMGISNGTQVVVYDTPGLMSAGRIWWTFRIFGHSRIAILNGGLKTWLAENRPVTAETTTHAPGSFIPDFNAAGIASRQDVFENITNRKRDLIDARSAARFNAVEKEARPGLRSGHVPGSLNLPFNLLTDVETGQIKPTPALKALYEQAGLDLDRPVIASCGSGVTACALVFSLHLLGKDDVLVYDGAWTEWGMPGDTPVEP